MFQQHIKQSFIGGIDYRVVASIKIYSATRNHHEHLFNEKTGIGINARNVKCNGSGNNDGMSWGPNAKWKFGYDTGTPMGADVNGDTWYPHGAYSTPWPTGYTEFASWAVYFRKYGKSSRETGSHLEKYG